MRGNASSCGSPVLLGRWETCGPLLSLFSRRNPAAFVLCYLRSCFRVSSRFRPFLITDPAGVPARSLDFASLVQSPGGNPFGDKRAVGMHAHKKFPHSKRPRVSAAEPVGRLRGGYFPLLPEHILMAIPTKKKPLQNGNMTVICP